MNLYISDLHLFHTNVTQAGKNFDNRPYADIDEMNADILKRWNAKVTNADHVYILGDLLWKVTNESIELLEQFNGNLHLILGNHDRDKSARFKKRFDEITHYKHLTDTDGEQERAVILSHFYMPFYERHLHKSILLYGHSHVSIEAERERQMTKWLNEHNSYTEAYNVGCMYPYMDYTPQSLKDIISGYKKWEKENV